MHGCSRASGCMGLATLLVMAWGLVCPPAMLATSSTLDVIDVQQVDRELVGVRNDAPSVRVRLLRGERVQWLGARGTLGLALTDRRFLALSATGSGWQAVSLGRDDVAPRVWLGANVAVCATQRRLLYVGSGPGVIGELPLSPGEALVAVEADEFVASAVTDRRVLGFSADTSHVAERRFHVQERFESVTTRASTSTVRTSERLLVYKQSGGGWLEER